MIRLKTYLTLCIACLAVLTTQAQDVHFSQYSITQFMVNPALTGLFKGDFRASVHYRSQWQSVGNGYTTSAMSVDAPFLNKVSEKTYLGVGLSLYSDKAGTGNYGTTQINTSISGIHHLTVQHVIAAGFNASYVQRSLDQTQFTWSSQYDPSMGYNANLSTEENALLNSVNNFDVSAGVVWKFRSHNSPNIYLDQFRSRVGFAMHHVNTPNMSLVEGLQDDAKIKYVAHASGWVKMADRLALLPSFYYLKQGPHSEVVTGALVRVEVQPRAKYGKLNGFDILLGSQYRVGDALIPTAAFRVNNYELRISYDVNVSSLTTASQYMGGLEVGLIFRTPNPFTGNRISLRMGDQRI